MSEQSNSAILGKSMYIHIAAEVVVVGGLAFYLSKRCSSLESKVDQLEQAVKLLMDENHKIKNMLSYHGDLINKKSSSKKKKVQIQECDDDVCPLNEEELDSKVRDEISEQL